MFEDYTRLILQDYTLKKQNGLLPISLSKPSPAGLKAECIRICKARFSPRDEPIFWIFFDRNGGKEQILQAMNSIDIDKFRPLEKFLKGKTSRPDEKNIELLAWMIDFQPRPFEHGLEFLKKLEKLELADEKSLPKISEEELGLFSDNSNETRSMKKSSKLSARKWILGLGIMSATGIGAFWNWSGSEKPKKSVIKCMYWSNNQYNEIPCNQVLGDTIIIASDSILLKNFKRITRPDTITIKSVGKVCYSKKNKKLEYFTMEGRHPEDPNRKLRPLSVYMYNKYLKPGQDLAK